MFATLAAARTAASESFAADRRIAAVYFEVAGTEYRFGRQGDVVDVAYLNTLAAKPAFAPASADHTCTTLCSAECPLA